MDENLKAHMEGDDTTRACKRAGDVMCQTAAGVKKAWDALEKASAFVDPFMRTLDGFTNAPEVCDHSGEEMRLARQELAVAYSQLRQRWDRFNELARNVIKATLTHDKAGLAFDAAVDACSICGDDAPTTH